MPIGGFGIGFSNALADYMGQERQRQRQSEDQQIDYQMELIKSLAARPDINERPEIMGQAIHDMMELASAKGGKGKQSKGMAGMMGQHDLPVSQFLSGLVSGARPMVGPTQEPNPEMPSEGNASALQRMPSAPSNEQQFQQWYAGHAAKNGLNPNPDDPQHFYDYRAAYNAGASPDATGHWPSDFKSEGHPNLIVNGQDTRTGNLASRPSQGEGMLGMPSVPQQPTSGVNPPMAMPMHAPAPTGGKAILESPISMPPQGIHGPPEAVRLIEAGRGMQAQAAINPPPPVRMQPVAPEKQPYFRAPNEMAQEQGEAAGIKAKAVARGTRDADREAAYEAGLTPEEYKEGLKHKMMGNLRQNVLQDAAGGQYMLDGKIIDTRVIFDSATGTTKTVNALTGQPLDPRAEPYIKAPVPRNPPGPGTPDQQSLNARLEAFAAKTGRKVIDLTPAERDQVMTQWQNEDANRKAVKPSNITVHNAQGLSGNQQFQALDKLQQQWRKAAGPYTTMINQYNLMQEGMKQAQAGNMNSGSQAILVTFQKILDPNSVVRESEYARSPEGLGLLQRMQGAMQKLSMGGAGVTPQDLQGFVATAAQLLKGLEGSLAPTRQQLTSAAALAGIDPKNIFGSETGLPEINGPKKGLNDFRKTIPAPPVRK